MSVTTFLSGDCRRSVTFQFADNSSTTCLSLSQNPAPNRESGGPHARNAQLASKCGPHRVTEVDYIAEDKLECACESAVRFEAE
jgi:hypothetical protein